jgi:coproporphyrinogen III oxidase-like Fe-S oxidoreductase
MAFGPQRTRTCDEMVQRGLAARDGSRLRLTPRGLLVADEITARLMATDAGTAETRS